MTLRGCSFSQSWPEQFCLTCSREKCQTAKHLLGFPSGEARGAAHAPSHNHGSGNFDGGTAGRNHASSHLRKLGDGSTHGFSQLWLRQFYLSGSQEKWQEASAFLISWLRKQVGVPNFSWLQLRQFCPSARRSGKEQCPPLGF